MYKWMTQGFFSCPLFYSLKRHFTSFSFYNSYYSNFSSINFYLSPTLDSRLQTRNSKLELLYFTATFIILLFYALAPPFNHEDCTSCIQEYKSFSLVSLQIQIHHQQHHHHRRSRPLISVICFHHGFNLDSPHSLTRICTCTKHNIS